MNGNLSIKVCGVWSFWQSGLLDWLKEITTLIIRKKKHKTKRTKKKNQTNKQKKNKKKKKTKKKITKQNKTKIYS